MSKTLSSANTNLAQFCLFQSRILHDICLNIVFVIVVVIVTSSVITIGNSAYLVQCSYCSLLMYLHVVYCRSVFFNIMSLSLFFFVQPGGMFPWCESISFGWWNHLLQEGDETI